MTQGASVQLGPDNARLKGDMEREDRRLQRGLDGATRRLASIEGYLKGPLRTWLEGLAATAGFTDDYPEPPF